MPRFVSATLAAIVLALPLAAFAQPLAATAGASAPVQVQGNRLAEPPRRDVASVCPALHEQLPEALASAWQRAGRPGVARARFTLRGDRVLNIESIEGHRAHQRGLRWALQDLACRSDHAGDQVFEIVVRFVDGDEASTVRRVAVLER